MIGKLSGIVDTIGEDYAILDVQGVGAPGPAGAGMMKKTPDHSGMKM